MITVLRNQRNRNANRTHQIWLFPLVFVALCAYVIYDWRQKRKLAEEKRAIAEEARATADRLAEEACIAADPYARAMAEARVINMLTPEAVALFTDPN